MMNTEPPTGDDLNRMLVSMKQNVLERTTDQQPPRAPRHIGLIIGLVALIGLGSASGAVALGLVPKPFAERASVVPTATEDPAPPVTETEAPPTTAPAVPPVKRVSIPTDCKAVVPVGDYDRIFGATPLQQIPPGVTIPPAPVPTGLTPVFFGDSAFDCTWMDPHADVTGISIEIGTSTPSVLAQHLAGLEKQKFTCVESHSGTSCHLVTRSEEYPVDSTITFFVRGDTWIQVRQTNFPTSDLIGAIVSQLWK
jgi:hypothetical protein